MHRLPPWYPRKPHSKAARTPATTPVAIIGGGITGISTAYHLSRLGIPCTVIEADIIASGASGKNLGMLTPGTEHDFREAMQKYGVRKAKQLWNTSIETIRTLQKTVQKENLGNIISQTGHLNIALHKTHIQPLKEEYHAMRKAGLRAQWLEGNALRKRINSPLAFAGVRVPYTCSLHPPTQLIHGLATASADNGAGIVERARVKHIKQGMLITNHGKIVAENIVIATEGYTPHGWIPDHLHTRRDTALAAAPLSKKWFEKHWPGNELVWNYGVHYCALKKTPDGKVFLFASEGTKKGFAEFFPNTNLRTTHRWSCRIAGYADQLPRIGKHPTMKNTYFAGGYRGHGLVFGYLAGEIIADLIASKKNKHATLFAPC